MRGGTTPSRDSKRFNNLNRRRYHDTELYNGIRECFPVDHKYDRDLRVGWEELQKTLVSLVNTAPTNRYHTPKNVLDCGTINCFMIYGRNINCFMIYGGTINC